MKQKKAWDRYFTFKNLKTLDMPKYQREYQQQYGERELVREYKDGLSAIRYFIRAGRGCPVSVGELEQIVCCDYRKLLSHLGLDDERILNAYRAGEYEIDHLIPKKWFSTHPSYTHYLNHFSNLRILPKGLNREKAGSIDFSDIQVVLLMMKMRLDKQWLDMAKEFPDHEERALFFQEFTRQTTGAIK